MKILSSAGPGLRGKGSCGGVMRVGGHALPTAPPQPDRQGGVQKGSVHPRDRPGDYDGQLSQPGYPMRQKERDRSCPCPQATNQGRPISK